MSKECIHCICPNTWDYNRSTYQCSSCSYIYCCDTPPVSMFCDLCSQPLDLIFPFQPECNSPTYYSEIKEVKDE